MKSSYNGCWGFLHQSSPNFVLHDCPLTSINDAALQYVYSKANQRYAFQQHLIRFVAAQDIIPEAGSLSVSYIVILIIQHTPHNFFFMQVFFNVFEKFSPRLYLLWNILTILNNFQIVIYLKTYFFPVMQSWIFSCHYSNLQCHMILQKSFWYVYSITLVLSKYFLLLLPMLKTVVLLNIFMESAIHFSGLFDESKKIV